MSARTTRTPVGTPMYMAPELCAGLPYTQKADVWALGCILYEMCALRPAFIAQNIDMLMAKIQRGQHDRGLPRHYSCDTAELIEALLCVDSSMRLGLSDLQRLPYLAPFFEDAPYTRVTRGTHIPVPVPTTTTATIAPPPPPEIVIFANSTRRRSSAHIRLPPLDDNGSHYQGSSPDISSPGSISPTSMLDHEPTSSDPGLPRSPHMAARRHVSPQHAGRRSSERDRRSDKGGGSGSGVDENKAERGERGERVEREKNRDRGGERSGSERDLSPARPHVSLPLDEESGRPGHQQSASPRVTLTPSPTSSDQRQGDEHGMRPEDGRVEYLRRERGSRSSSLSPTPRRASESRADLLSGQERRMSLQPVALEENVRDPRVGSSGRLSPLTPLGPIPHGHGALPSSPLAAHAPLAHGSSSALLSPTSPFTANLSPFTGGGGAGGGVSNNIGSGSHALTTSPSPHAPTQQTSSPTSPVSPTPHHALFTSPLSGPTISVPAPASTTPPPPPHPLGSGSGSSTSLGVASAHPSSSRSSSPEPHQPVRRRSSLVPRAVSPQVRLPPVRM